MTTTKQKKMFNIHAEHKQHPPNSVLRELGALAVKMLAISIVFILVFTFIYGLHRTVDSDMAPMVKDGDVVLFYRWSGSYAIGDLVLLNFQGERQVRRIVAQAGDHVDITEEGLYINGVLHHEREIFEKTRRYTEGIDFPITIGEGQIFVLGDARENATDSRIYGPINTDDTLGTAITVIRRRNL
jgi:signal peptidase I